MWRLVTVALATMLGVTGAFGADEPKFSAAQLEEMVAPIALYPDELLTQVCIAATYPLEVVEAQRWVGKNPALKGDELDKALAQEDWDDSVKWLTHFPDVLKRMSENLQWTQDLGNAFLEQQAEVMDAAQRMRAKAAAAGTLKTTPQQTVIKEKEVIRIVPADPQVVYVPTYAPATVYGPSYMPPPTPYYPSFWATPGGAVTAGVIGFGVGIGTAALFSSAFDWNDHNVYVHGNGWGGGGGNVNVNKNVNINNQNFNNQSLKANGKKWEHNAEHRRGVGYRDQKTAQKYGGRDRANAQNRAARDQARGREGAGAGAGGDRLAGAQRPSGGGRPEGGGRPGGGADRPGGGANRPGAGQRPGGGGGAAAKPVAKPAARPATRPASGGSRDAFADRGGGNAARQASARGAASRGSVSRAGGGGFGGGGGQGGGGFGGGGGHGGGRGGGGGHRGGGGGGGGRRR